MGTRLVLLAGLQFPVELLRGLVLIGVPLVQLALIRLSDHEKPTFTRNRSTGLASPHPNSYVSIIEQSSIDLSLSEEY
jgi:hypothetical protein